MKGPLFYLEALGRRLADDWAKSNFDSRCFPDLAADHLAKARLESTVPIDSLHEWLATTPWLPEQEDLDASFSEPPLTLFVHPRFYIEALHWSAGTPGIHHHSFSGAFSVLAGSSLHSRYTFVSECRINERLSLGWLRLSDCHVLPTGAVEPIVPGASLIHSTFHLDSPSITLVVRTYRDVEHGVQHSYYRPHLAIDPFFKDPLLIRRLQVLRHLEAIGSPDFELRTRQCLVNSDLYGVYKLLEHLRFSRRGAPYLGEMCELLRAKHGSHVDQLRDTVDERHRESIVRRYRETVTDPEQRFLVGLLLALPTREPIATAIATRHPGEDPWHWMIRTLCEMPVRTSRSWSAPGPSDRDSLKLLFEDTSALNVPGRATSEGCEERCRQLRESPLLSPLFRTAEGETGRSHFAGEAKCH
jgi:hypothetical protein